jgi:hypothetical protein
MLKEFRSRLNTQKREPKISCSWIELNKPVSTRTMISKFQVKFHPRANWGIPDTLLPPEGFFMEGSRGSNIYSEQRGVNLSFCLGRSVTVLQIEIHAISTCAEYCRELMFANKTICICSDSRAALPCPKILLNQARA